MVLAFSAYKNGKNLFACKSNQSPDFMPCLDGIRVIATLWIIAHNFATFLYPLLINPSNQDPMVDLINGIFNAGRFSLDTFFVMGALVATNKMLLELST